MIEVKSLVDLILVTLSLKIILSEWTPPIQRSLQAILCVFLGTMISLLFDPTKDGLMTGLIASSFAFYGGQLLQAFKGVAKDLDEYKNDKE